MLAIKNSETLSEEIQSLCAMNSFIRQRTREEIRATLSSWEVCKHESDELIGCCQKIQLDEYWTELGAFMVHPNYQNTGIGRKLWNLFNQSTSTSWAFAIVSQRNEIAQNFFKKMRVEISEFPTSLDIAKREIQDRVCFVWQPKNMDQS